LRANPQEKLSAENAEAAQNDGAPSARKKNIVIPAKAGTQMFEFEGGAWVVGDVFPGNG
jgi:hypothetical protein